VIFRGQSRCPLIFVPCQLAHHGGGCGGSGTPRGRSGGAGCRGDGASAPRKPQPDRPLAAPSVLTNSHACPASTIVQLTWDGEYSGRVGRQITANSHRAGLTRATRAGAYCCGVSARVRGASSGRDLRRGGSRSSTPARRAQRCLRLARRRASQQTSEPLVAPDRTPPVSPWLAGATVLPRRRSPTLAGFHPTFRYSL
jgi:hypothetical protein